ncbi:MAG: hypothetical protein F4139_02275 [Gemmatimonadetes bacterium]|nr:hypothetical protein [Gemmatimonadota bacterium]MYA65171.1 hypothetical protein [Gemmatimonadota bacterium]MYB97648.1 hypothetical protein [Gemmatimonadota bacterium]MYH51756.1 hypothetical protein [Gemmatimonadota bacterium]MYI45148.1 hypothetical protein [Gemmatimonadota bacterium]
MTGSIRMGRIVLVLALYAGALTMVAWRQSTTRETMEEIGRLSRELAIAAEEREELARDLLGLEQRRWVVAEAARRLGLRPPREDEMVFTSRGPQ